MVHALDEIRRVLVPDGLLIDLRALQDRWPIEVFSSRTIQEAGRAIDLPEALADDIAADRAMAEGVARGWFVRERHETFPLFYYWDTPKEMQEYIEENWNAWIEIGADSWNNSRSTWATADADARLRVRMKMMITRYKKSGEEI